MAAGGFVTRALDSMLKECSGKNYPELQKAIQTYTGGPIFHIPGSHFALPFCFHLFVIVLPRLLPRVILDDLEF